MTIEVTDADVRAVEDVVGRESFTWGNIGPKAIIYAAWEVMRRKQEADITKERDKLKEEVCKLRALLLGVLENDEDAEFYNNANLGGLRQRIRDAIAWEVMK